MPLPEIKKRNPLKDGIDTRIAETLRMSDPVEVHVHETWPKLSRSMADIFLGGCFDKKVPLPKDNKYILYISQKEDAQRVAREMEEGRAQAEEILKTRNGKMKDFKIPEVILKRLPEQKDWSSIAPDEHGLLYVPKPYIVPGVRYNEMYNWDSMFVVRGLLESKKFNEAKHVVDDLLYQQEHYGTILCGNRSYYLSSGKSRSQPPLVTSKVLNIYDNWDQLSGHDQKDKQAWLENAAQQITAHSQHWLTKPHIHEKSGMSLYSATNGQPSAEVEHGEPGHYQGALEMLKEMYFKQKKIGAQRDLSYQDRKDRYYIDQYLIVSPDEKSFKLSPDFYRGDSAMRESGFDPSRRFGIYNVDIINHLPVCLNSLRYKNEEGVAEIYAKLAEDDPAHAKKWQGEKERWSKKAQQTKQQINDWLWDDGKEDGKQVRPPCFRDRNINTEMCKKHGISEFRDYNFATMLFPLWVGAATQEQADKTVAHVIPALKTRFGLNTSDRSDTGCQWDKPLMWAPLQVVAVEALEKYGYYHEALDVAMGFLQTVSKDFKRTGALWEKYESVSGSSDIAKHITKGYAENDQGFAWTNASVIELRYAIKRLQQKIHHKPVSTDEPAEIRRPVAQHTDEPVAPPRDDATVINPAHASRPPTGRRKSNH